MNRLKKISLWFVGCMVAVGVIGGLAAPPLVKSILVDKLSQRLHRSVAIEGLHINPYTLTVTVSGFSMRDRDGAEALLRFDELFINVSAASLWHRAPVVEELRLKAPQLKLARLAAKRYNVSDLIEEFSQPDRQPDVDGPPARFSVNNIQIIDGRIEFDDKPYEKKHVADAINVTLPFISSLPYFADQYVAPGFSARVNGTPVALKGKSKPFSDGHETTIDINEENLDLTKYVEYVPLNLKVKLASALLDAKLSLGFSQKKDATPQVSLTGTAALKNVAINKPDGDWLLKFARIETVLRSLDLAKRHADVASIQLTAPEVNLLRDRAGALDLIALLSTGADKSPPAKGAARDGADSPFVVDVGEIRLSGGRVAFRDESVAPEFRGEIKGVNVVARDFASDGKRPAQMEVSLTTDAGGQLQTTSRLNLSPLSVEGKVSLSGIQPKAYAAYYRNTLLLDVQEGNLDVTCGYRYAQTSNGTEFALGGLGAKLENLRLRQRGEKADFLNLPLLQVSGTDVDLAKQNLAIGEITTQDARLNVTRNAKNEWSLASLTSPAKLVAGAKPQPDAKPWSIAVRKVSLNGYAVNVEDRAFATPARFLIDNLAVSAENFSTARDSKFSANLKLRLNKRGTLQTSGTITLAPVAANLKVDMRNIDLVAFQPYFAGRIKITLVSGAATVKGAVSFREQGKTPQFGFTGDAGIAALHSVDKANASDFLKWKSLDMHGVKTRGMPLDVAIADISLKDFYSRLIVNSDGKLNLQQILVSEAEAPESADASLAKTGEIKTEQPVSSPAPSSTASDDAPDYNIRIGGIALSGGTVDFSDRFVKPNYSADLTEIGGAVAALSSDPATRAEVKLTGRVNNDAPLDITGSINPLAKALYLDLVASAKGIELSPLTPYAAKYAGYGIEKGKLSLDVKYHIEDGKLTADNKIFLDQLTFGAKVDSPTATKLPVLLALALLKDRNGNIDINLPVSGSLNDPQFSIGGLIVKVIINLLVKVATSPFALLGAIFGGGEELNTIDFDPGRMVITAASETKLKSVAKALVDRPALKLEITGHAAAADDAEAAKKASLEKKIRAQKLTSSAKQGASVDESEPVKITPEEYPKLLEAVYKQEKFAKPKNLIGFAKSLPPEEMEKLILANTKMTDEDLTELATARARAVRDWLVTKGPVPAERIFLVASKLGGGSSEKLAGKITRVDLSLK